jgi:hypothetical protein
MSPSALELFMAQHRNVHASTDGVLSLQNLICGPLTHEQIREMPDGHNSIAWILWHVTRWEDSIVNACLLSEREVLDTEDWLPRLHTGRRDVGAGMTVDEVRDFSLHVDVGALIAYRAAVADKTRSALRNNHFADLETSVAGATARATPDFDSGREGQFLLNALDRQPKGWLLGYGVMGHCYYHLGQARSVATLLNNPSF